MSSTAGVAGRLGSELEGLLFAVVIVVVTQESVLTVQLSVLVLSLSLARWSWLAGCFSWSDSMLLPLDLVLDSVLDVM